MRQAAARHARHAIAQWPSRQQRSDRRSSRRRWSRWQGRRVERRRGGLGRRVARVARVHLQHPARDRSRSPRSRSRLEVNHQLAAAALSERHAPCRRHDGVMIDTASSSRDEGSVGGSGAADGAIRPAKSRPRDDRHQVTQATSSPCPCPPSRSRPSEITEIASSSRDEGPVGGGGAVRAPYAPPKSRRRDDRPQFSPLTPSPRPPSRSRPPEITEISSSS